MRPILLIVLAIFLIAGAYTAYGVFMFEPQKPAPLVFNEPDPATLQTLFADNAQEVPVLPLTPAQEKQTDDAVQRIGEAMSTYRQNEENAGLRLKATISLLNGLIASGKMPAYFLNVGDGAAARNFELLEINPKSEITVAELKKDIACENENGNAYQVLIGDDASNVLSCGNTPIGEGDRIFLGGPGNDSITDGTGNRIINAGSGDDVITLGRGRTILVLEDAWGKDSVTADCSGAEIPKGEIPQGFPIPWTSNFTNFIVLSPRIKTEAVSWQNNILVNSATGDTLTVDNNCFTLVRPN